MKGMLQRTGFATSRHEITLAGTDQQDPDAKISENTYNKRHD
jgi:hypothetical protein